MPLFQYEATDKMGRLVPGVMDAPDIAGVDSRLRQMGYQTERVAPAQSALPKGTGRQSVMIAAPVAYKTHAFPRPTVSRLGGVKPRDLALFFNQFASMIVAGITPFQALQNLAPRTSNFAIRTAAQEMCDQAKLGGTLSEAMAQYPRIFAPHIIGAVRAGEKGGFLEIVLLEVAQEYEQEVAFYKGMWFPISLMVQQFIAVVLAQPLFPTLFPEGKTALYFQLALLRNLPIALLIIAAACGYWLWMKEPERRYQRDSMTLRIPVFGNLARQRSLAGFLRTLKRLYNAGVGPINAWEGAMNVAPNAAIREKLQQAYGMMQQNIPMHEAFIATRLFADEAEQLLATGIFAGQVVEMLDRITKYYDDNVERAFKGARNLMYRLCIIVFIVCMGIVACWMTYSYFHGIFNWVDNEFPT